VHIGLQKTGSTAIQAFLSRNRSALLKKGVLYPEGILGNRKQYRLTYSLVDNVDSLLGAYSREQIQESFRQLIEKTRKATIIISDENLSWLNDPRRLKSLLNGCQVKVIVFLRRHDDWFKSFYYYEVEHWKNHDSIEEYRIQPKYWGLNYDYYKELQRWSDVFGKENIIVMPFEQEQMPGGLLRYFTGVIDADWSGIDMAQEKYRENVSIKNPAIIELLRLSNKATGDCALLRTLVRAHLKDEVVRNDDVEIMPYQLRVSLIKDYEPSNARIAREFMGRPDGRLFLAPLPTPYQHIPQDTLLSKENVIEKLIGLLAIQDRQISKMRSRRTFMSAVNRVLKQIRYGGSIR